MAILRDDLPRFATAAVCRSSRKEEIVTDLTDAGVTKQAAQRMVDQLLRIHEELRADGADGLEERVLQAWSSWVSPLEFTAGTEPVGAESPALLPLRLVKEKQVQSFLGWSLLILSGLLLVCCLLLGGFGLLLMAFSGGSEGHVRAKGEAKLHSLMIFWGSILLAMLIGMVVSFFTGRFLLRNNRDRSDPEERR